MTLAAGIRKLEMARAVKREAQRTACVAGMTDEQLDAEIAGAVTYSDDYRAFGEALTGGDLYALSASKAHTRRSASPPRQTR